MVLAGCATAGTSRPPAAGRRSTTTTTSPATFGGPDGVEARWVIDENRKPGSPGWAITGTPPGTMAGFAGSVSAVAGDTVSLYVSTDAATFEVDAYRMGYYGGAGARLVWRSATETGHLQPPCPLTPGTNMVACDNWTVSLHVPITAAFVQGDYLFKLVGSGGQASYVPLTVEDPSSHATYLVKNDVYTWQAWNPYGGYDFYTGQGSCPPDVYPLCTRARVVSFDRPYGYVDGAADFLGSEYPLVRYMEQHGLDVTYTTDVDVEQDPSVLANHEAILSLGHDECWSATERQAVQGAEHQGLNVVFFAASAMLRHVRLQASPLGADREEVDYRDSSADPLDGQGNPLEVTGNTWSSPPASWSEVPFVGENYTGFVEPGQPAVPFVVVDAGAWIYAGTGLHDGSTIPAALGSDFDAYDPGLSPADLQLFGHSPIPTQEAETQLSQPYSDMSYWTDPASGAGVFDSGINSWIPDLGPCPAGTTSCPDTVVGQMTGNLLALFGKGPAGRFEPSQANASQVYG